MLRLCWHYRPIEDGRDRQRGLVELDLATNPSPSVQATGIAGRGRDQVWLERDHPPTRHPNIMTDTAKPPYKVPTMDDVRAVPWNGRTVISTFAGGGGSSTGYRLAGYRVLAAVEFVPAAQDTYAANMADHTKLVRKDIREVTADELLDLTDLKTGELDVLDGSPPCEPFSSAGKRDKKWGQVHDYSGQRQRSDDLFFEYARLLEGLRPRAFVAENVAGLVRGRAKGYFKEIHARLQAAGYRVAAAKLDAQWLGVPQTRERIIFIGVRDDLDEKIVPAFPAPLAYRYTVRDALPWIFRFGTDPGWDKRRAEKLTDDDMMVNADRPHPTVSASGPKTNVTPGSTGNPGVVDAEPESGDRAIHDTGAGPTWQGGEPRDVSDVPAPAVTASNGAAHLHVEREADRVVHDTKGQHGARGDVTDHPAPAILAGGGNHPGSQAAQISVERDANERDLKGDRATAGSFETFHQRNDVTDEPMPAVLAGQQWHQTVDRDVPDNRAVHYNDHGQHASKGDVTDQPAPAVLHGKGAESRDLGIHQPRDEWPPEAQPQPVTAGEAEHATGVKRDVDPAGERAVHDVADGVKRSQGNVTDRPAPSVLARGEQAREISVERAAGDDAQPDGQTRVPVGDGGRWRVVELPDGRLVERRKFTIQELKAISAFPPDYVIHGSYSIQWERLGDCVPPLMMRAIAETVETEILAKADPKTTKNARQRTKRRQARTGGTP